VCCVRRAGKSPRRTQLVQQGRHVRARRPHNAAGPFLRVVLQRPLVSPTSRLRAR
jgi:hypothetical protein